MQKRVTTPKQSNAPMQKRVTTEETTTSPKSEQKGINAYRSNRLIEKHDELIHYNTVITNRRKR
ncbi:hypothetical protein [Candidatus Bathycorpusculum sp.]|uniref:hypothetical protein n=1 Tax=Candidatus Bathycorpusculum sp. TaxID=2994959 RepID=UPI0028253D48|nr:hypothetical protein [Candidatus Termitimicrobium sp.]